MNRLRTIVTLVFELGLSVIGALVVVSSPSVRVGNLLVWELIAIVYLLGRGVGLVLDAHRRVPEVRVRAARSYVTWSLGLVTSVVGIISAVLILFPGITPFSALFDSSQTQSRFSFFIFDFEDIVGQESLQAFARHLTLVIGVIGVVLSWIILHFGFAARYRQLVAKAAPEPAMDFPGTADPRWVDFVYFSFTIGTVLGPDVKVLTSRGRLIVLAHTVTSFFFNAAILGIAFGVLRS